MISFPTNSKSSYQYLTTVEQTQGGQRFPRRSELIRTLTKQRVRSYGESWSIIKMYSPGTKENWAVILLENIP
jgi:hypothetical protein